MVAARTSRSRWWQGLFLLLLLVAMTGETWAATGQVTITGPVPGPSGSYETNGDFVIQGTCIMTEDSTPVPGVGTWEPCKELYPYMGGRAWFAPACWNTAQWVGTHATLVYEVDGARKGSLDEVKYWSGPNPGNELGQLKGFSTVVNISGLKPRPYHTVKVFLEDRFGVSCYYSLYNADPIFCPSGGGFASATLTFITPDDSPPVDTGKNLGDPNASCPVIGTKHPINLATGNKYFREDDFDLKTVGGNLFFSRSYNSQSSYDGPLGYGWTHNHNLVLEVVDPGTVRIMKGDGRHAYFVKTLDNLFRGTGSNYAHIELSGTEYILHETNGNLFIFDANGTLNRIEDRHGNATVPTYEGGLLRSVQDLVSGRTLIFTYSDGKLVNINGPATAENLSGLLVSFGYTHGNLTRVTYPDGESFLYFYEDARDLHNLTRKTKSDGVTVLNGVAYDSEDRAIGSCLNGGTEALTITHGHWQATVTDSQGRVKVYKYDVINGIGVPLEVEGDGCSGCASRYEYGASSATDPHQLSDDFSGSDGSAPDPRRWAILSGSPEIRGNKLWLDGTTSDQVIESVQEFQGDFDVQVDFEVDTGPATNGWGLFLYAECGENKIGMRFDYPGTGANSDAYRFVFYDGSWHDIGVSGFSPHGYLRQGKLRLARSGSVFSAYGWYGKAWRALGNKAFLEPWKSVKLRLGLMRWGDNPQPRGYLDTFEIVYGELTPSKTFNLLSVTSRNGVITRYSDYDMGSNAQKVTEVSGTPAERVTTYTYHPSLKGEPLTVTKASVLNPQGYKVTTFDYDNDGNDIPNEAPTKRVQRILEQGYTWDGSGALHEFSREKRFTYNARGQIASIDGPRPGPGDTVSYTYYENGDLRSIIRPNGGTVSFDDYDALGRVGRMVDENGHETTYTYDARGRLTSIATEAGTTWITRIDLGATGRSEVVASPNGTSLRSTYDVTGKLVGLSDSLGNRITYTYDSEGNRVSELTYGATGELGRSIQYQYDGLNRLWRTIYPDGTEYEEYGYDAVGNRTSVRNTAGAITSYLYDSLNRLKEVVEPGEVRTRYAYDQGDNLISVTDAEGHVTSYTYDDAGRVIETLSPDTGRTRYTYDDAGNLSSRTDARGITVLYGYDFLNRLTLVDYPTDSDVIYTYDEGPNGMGRLTEMADGSGSSRYSYDALGNLIREEKRVLGATYATEYRYDPSGILTAMTYPDGIRVEYELDSGGRVGRVRATRDGVTKTLADEISYAPFGPLTSLRYGNGTLLSQSYDRRYRLTALKAGGVLDLAYGRDGSGNITTITSNLDPARSQGFGYDALERITGATGVYGSLGYAYDRVGNRLSQTIRGEPETYGYETGTNRLAEVVAPGGSSTLYAHDAGGSVIASGDTELRRNEESRLIQAVRGGSLVGEYTYNGSGQRVIKTASGATTIFHYDREGNLIAESRPDGPFRSSFVYLGDLRLARIDSGGEAPFTVRVETTLGRKPSGLSVYAFTEADSYTGKRGATDSQGIALFQPGDLAAGSYRFRTDYLGLQFWSEVIALPGTGSTLILIPEETAEIAVTTAWGPAEGVRVYVFTENGSYLGVYGETDETGAVSFDLPVGGTYRFRADILGNQYWSKPTTISGGGVNAVAVAAGGGLFQVTVEKGPGLPLSAVRVYLFGPSGSYLGRSQTSDASGMVGFAVPQGTYKVRADYLGYQFWSGETMVGADTAILLTISHRAVEVTVSALFQGGREPLPSVPVYLFTAGGSYLGRSAVTDAVGQVSFDLPERAFTVRADYLGGQFWSGAFTWETTTVEIPMAEAAVTVTGMGHTLPGVEVYAFSEAGSYLGLHGKTGGDGRVLFRLPRGAYLFRADYQGSEFWSGEQEVEPDETHEVTIPTGGGSFTLSVVKDAGTPLPGLSCYVFSDEGSYLGISRTTGSDGRASFDLADGGYRIRVDYLGYQFWSDLVEVLGTLDLEMVIPHKDVAVTVEGSFAGNRQPRASLPVYLFSPSGSYLSVKTTTDASGRTVLSLPEKPYNVRVDYLGSQFWSGTFTGEDTIVTIPEGIARVAVRMGSQVITGAPVYVFSSGGSYLGLSVKTDTIGVVEFRLPAASYRFRADLQGSQFWVSAGVLPDIVNYVDLNTGGGEFHLFVDTGSGPLVGVKVYVFSAGGSYLGVSGTTGSAGEISFALSQGSYKFRVDYLGYQFWSVVYDVPEELGDTFTIPHDKVAITVRGRYLTSDPIPGVKVYLFTPGGSYVGQSQTTDAAGRVSFTIPEREYKVRVDYLGNQFWSEVFQARDCEITLEEGVARIRVHRSGVSQLGLKVYLFSPGGSYLGRNITTDAHGEVEFLLPDRSFKFRVDQGGKQYWSGAVPIISGGENLIELDLDRLALLETNNPHPQIFHGTPPAETRTVRLASLTMIPGLLANAITTALPRTAVYYYHNDHLGTPQRMTDESGAVVWSADYKPFGEVTITTETITNNFRFPGQYYDQETGLHYNWHRYYDPATGRYLTADPIGLGGGTDLFSYVQNNPVNLYDPPGLIVEGVISEFGFARSGLVSELWRQITGIYLGAEAHTLYGYGRDTVYCCDEQNRRWRVRTSKHCLGAALGVSGGGGIFPFKNRRQNCPYGFSGFAFEAGAGPLEAGVGINDPLAWSGGVGQGIGGKFTVCYYRILSAEVIDNCCEQE